MYILFIKNTFIYCSINIRIIEKYTGRLYGFFFQFGFDILICVSVSVYVFYMRLKRLIEMTYHVIKFFFTYFV